MIYKVDFFSLCAGELTMYVKAKDEEDAILIANKQKALKHPNYVMSGVFANELDIVSGADLNDVDGYDNFNRVVANFDDIGELVFDSNTEFRDYCEERDISYSFDNNRMLKNNKPIGWFYGRYQRINEVEVEHYNSNKKLKGA